MSTKHDFIQRFLFEQSSLRGEYIQLAKTFQAIEGQHLYPEPIRQLLGEALTIAALLCSMIKFKGRLTVQFRGQGKLSLLMAQSTNDFHLRGLAQWKGELSSAELMDSLREGVLAVMLATEANQNTYQGIVNFKGDSLAESIEGYFRDSEQLTTKICLAVDEKRAVGLLLQAMPQADEEPNGKWEEICTLTQQLKSQDLLNLDMETLLAQLYPEEQMRIFEPRSVEFRCTCTEKRGEDALLLLGRSEAEAELKTNKEIVVTCEFCNKEYIFNRQQVTQLFERDMKDSGAKK
jgi:molecular chaperone Hsp33